MTDPSRRKLLHTALAGTAGILAAGLTACAGQRVPPATRATPEGEATPNQAQARQERVLLAYFSRAGENYHNGGRRDLTVGNTEVLARMINKRIDCDLYRIEPADPYPHSYDATVSRNVKEQNADARPEIAKPLPDIDNYTTVLLGSPVWNVQAPMIMNTFTDKLDLAGKTVLPFVTYAISGMGQVEQDYRTSLPDAQVGTGLAIRGEVVRHADQNLEKWLQNAGILA